MLDVIAKTPQKIKYTFVSLVLHVFLKQAKNKWFMSCVIYELCVL